MLSDVTVLFIGENFQTRFFRICQFLKGNLVAPLVSSGTGEPQWWCISFSYSVFWIIELLNYCSIDIHHSNYKKIFLNNDFTTSSLWNPQGQINVTKY